MALEEILTTQLSAVTGLSGKVHPINANPKESAPYLVYLKTGGEEYGILNGYTGTNQTRFELNLFHSSYSNVKALAASVTTKLKTLQGNTFSGTLIQALWFDENSPELYEEQLKMFRKILNITIIY